MRISKHVIVGFRFVKTLPFLDRQTQFHASPDPKLVELTGQKKPSIDLGRLIKIDRCLIKTIEEAAPIGNASAHIHSENSELKALRFNALLTSQQSITGSFSNLIPVRFNATGLSHCV